MDPFTNCARKEAFPSEEAAQARIRQWRRTFKVQGNPRPFRCKQCGQIHIGRRNGRRGRQ